MGKIALCLILCAAASARAEDNPPTQIDCAAFSKRDDGYWSVGPKTVVAIGNEKIELQRAIVGPKSMNLDGENLFDVINQKCGKK